MKLVFAWVFSLMTFFGVTSQANSNCGTSPLSLQDSTALSSPSSSPTQNSNPAFFADNKDKNADCHHDAVECRHCHLGHCPFTLVNSVHLEKTSLLQILTLKKVAVVIFDFHTGPFRPPIA